MDQGNGITVKCGVGDKMVPDITKDILGNERYLYCAGNLEGYIKLR